MRVRAVTLVLVPSVLIDAIQLAVGLACLYFGAEWLVGGAAGLARSFGIRQLIIGLTVVAYGTSSPELVVGISAGLRDQGAIAVGNVIGSNIANLGLILAVCALVRAPRVERQIVVRERRGACGADRRPRVDARIDRTPRVCARLHRLDDSDVTSRHRRSG